MNKTLDQINQTHSNILSSTINLVTEREIWKRRTLSLARQNKQCYLCLNKQDWNPESLTCQECSEPNTTICQLCNSRFLTKQMKEHESHTYCQACYVHLKKKEVSC